MNSRAFAALLISSLLSFEACFFFSGSLGFAPSKSHAQLAEERSSEGKYREAISEFLLHMEHRLASTTRPKDENPYFYFLLIGDLYLKLEEPTQAENSYMEAAAHDVLPELVRERFRGLGKWLEQREEYRFAIKVLERHRALDPIMFDFDIDRIHKKIVQKEIEEESANP